MYTCLCSHLASIPSLKHHHSCLDSLYSLFHAGQSKASIKKYKIINGGAAELVLDSLIGGTKGLSLPWGSYLTAHACILIRAVWYMVHNSLLALILWMWNEKKRPHVLWHSLIGQSRWVSQQQQLMSRWNLPGTPWRLLLWVLNLCTCVELNGQGAKGPPATQSVEADMNIAFHFLNLKKLPGPFFDKKLTCDLARNDTWDKCRDKGGTKVGT